MRYLFLFWAVALTISRANGQVPTWKEACAVAYTDTIVNGNRTFDFMVFGDSVIYMLGVHPDGGNFVNVKTTGTPRQVAKRALEYTHEGIVRKWRAQQMCGNDFVSNDMPVGLWLGLDEKGYTATWTTQDHHSYYQFFALLKGDSRVCFDRIMVPQSVDLGSAQGEAGRGTVSVALRMAGSLHGITDSTVVTKEMMLSATGIEVVVEDTIWKTVEFTITTIVNDSVMQATSQSADFTDEQRMVIGAASSGSEIYIETIKVMGPLGGIHTVGSKAVSVK